MMRSGKVVNWYTHVCHAAGNGGQHPFFGVVNCNVEISDMDMSAFVKEDIIGFEVAMKS
jgi:hypothetical protein